MDGKIVLRKQILLAKPFKRLNVDKTLDKDFLTMDIETINENVKLRPYLISAYDGDEYITSFNNDQNILFKNFFESLISKIYFRTTIIYAYNLSGFDGIFIMKHLLSLGKVTPLLHNGKLISIKVVIKGSNKSLNKTILFKDSFLLLPLDYHYKIIIF